jgi:hypothetical protein
LDFLFADGFPLLEFFQLPIQIFAFDPQPLRVEIALPQRRGTGLAFAFVGVFGSELK